MNEHAQAASAASPRPHAAPAKPPLSLSEAVTLSTIAAKPGSEEHASNLLCSALELLDDAATAADITLPVESLYCALAGLLSNLRHARHELAMLRESAIRHLDAEGVA